MLDFTRAAGKKNVAVGGRSDCSWKVSDNRSWMTAKPASVSGGGTVEIEVGANTGAARSGTVSIGGSSVAVAQAAPPPCPSSPPTVAPSSFDFTHKAGSKRVTVGGESRCSWSVSDDRSWIGATPATVSGGGSVTVSVDANPGVERTGSVTIGGAAVDVYQRPSPDVITCVYGVTPTAVSAGAAQTSRSLTVTAYMQNWPDIAGTPPVCTWTATTATNWIKLGTPAGATVPYTIQANTSTTARTGTITIADQTVKITQAGAAPPQKPCPKSPPSGLPTSLSFTRGALPRPRR